MYWLLRIITRVKNWLHEYLDVPDYESFKYFERQSSAYPNWWYNYKWWRESEYVDKLGFSQNPINKYKHEKKSTNSLS